MRVMPSVITDSEDDASVKLLNSYYNGLLWVCLIAAALGWLYFFTRKEASVGFITVLALGTFFAKQINQRGEPVVSGQNPNKINWLAEGCGWFL